jgi:hypothetical protein
MAVSHVRSLVVVGAVLVGISSACSGTRGAEVQSYAVVNDGDTLLFQVNTCNDESTEVTVVELENAIIVTARTDRSFSCGRDDCSDARPVELDEPLGDRLVVDSNDNEIPRRDS